MACKVPQESWAKTARLALQVTLVRLAIRVRQESAEVKATLAALELQAWKVLKE